MFLSKTYILHLPEGAIAFKSLFPREYLVTLQISHLVFVSFPQFQYFSGAESSWDNTFLSQQDSVGDCCKV